MPINYQPAIRRDANGDEYISTDYGIAAAPGWRNEGATDGSDHVVAIGNWKYFTVTLPGTGDNVIIATPCVIKQIRHRQYSNVGGPVAPSVGILLIKDGASVLGAGPAGMLGGDVYYDGQEGTTFRTNLTVNAASALDTLKLEGWYMPADPLVTF